MYKILFVLSLSAFIIVMLVIGMHDAYSRGQSKGYNKQLEIELNKQSFDDGGSRQAALRQILIGLETNRPWLFGKVVPLTSEADENKPTLCAQVSRALAGSRSNSDQVTSDLLYNIQTELQCE